MKSGIIAAALLLLTAANVAAEFYKYTDDQGRTHFVDDLSKVPDAYHFRVEPYAEPHDHLSDAEREALYRLNQQQSREAEAERRRHFDQLRQNQLKSVQDYLEQKKAAAVKETAIEVRNQQILVPVTLAYGNRKVETTLLLDTGASILALHQPVADELEIHHFKRAKAQVANGDIIDTKIATLSYVEVGPYRIENVRAGVFPFVGDSAHSGLLGMEVLQHLKYRVDLQKSVIRWEN